MSTMIYQPKYVRLDASTICQLKCPSCPTATGETGKRLGVGSLTFEDFRNFVRDNPYVAHIELSNWGEVFLNKDLVKILQYAYRHNVALHIANGANMNTIRTGVHEALVKYKLRRITCSIDGASEESYVKYRVKGNFAKVIENIKEINTWKEKYRSKYPILKWQFVPFSHNEHEIEKAKKMAAELNMEFFLKLDWDDLYDLPINSPARNKEFIGQENGLGVASRKEYREKYKTEYVEKTCCWDLWGAVQINYDGRVLGCPINYWNDYGNAFKDGLTQCLNNDKINYARQMLMGRKEAKPGIPCTSCKVYARLKKTNDWVKEEEVKILRHAGRWMILWENKIPAKRLILGIVRILKKFTTINVSSRKL